MLAQLEKKAKERRFQLVVIVLTWLTYLLGFSFLLPRASLSTYTLPAACLPVCITGWLFGTAAGAGAALVVFIFQSGVQSLFLPGRIGLETALVNRLDDFLLLAVAGMLAGCLQGMRSRTRQKEKLLAMTKDQLDTQNHLLRLINKVSLELINAEDWKASIPNLLTSLGTVSAVDHAYLLSFEIIPDGLLIKDQFHYHLHHDGCREMDPQILKKIELQNTNLNSWIQASLEKMVILGKSNDLTKGEKEILSSLARGSFAVHPITSNQTVQGLVGLESRNTQRTWEPIELDALQMLAQVLGSIINRQQIEEDLERRLIEIDTLHQTSQTTAAGDQLETTLNDILKQIFVLFEAHYANIYLYTQERFLLLTSLEESHQRALPFSRPKEIEFMKRVIANDQPLFIPDTHHHPLFHDLAFPVHGALSSFPLHGPSGINGIINIWFPEPHSFSDNEIKLLHLLANQTAAAITNEELFRAEKERRLLEESVREARLKLVSNLDLNLVLESILDQLTRLISIHQAAIYFYHQGKLEIAASQTGDEPRSEEFDPLSTRDDLAYQAAQSGQQVIRPPLAAKTKQRPAPTQKIALPLIFQESVIGVLRVDFPPPTYRIERTLRVLELLRDQAVIAINNARIYQAEKEQRKLAEALQKTGTIIKSSLELDTVLDKILAQIETVIPYDSVNLMLVEGNQARMVRHHGYQHLDPQTLDAVEKNVLDIDTFDTLQKMIETKQPLIIPDTVADPRWEETGTSSRIRSWVGAPIIHDDQVIGFLSLNKNQRNFYRREHGMRIAAFASQAAIALKHAHLYQAEARRRREAETLRKTQESLLHISRAIGSSMDFNKIADLVISYTRELLPVDHALIFLWDDEKQAFMPHRTPSTDWGDVEISEERLRHFAGSQIGSAHV